MARTMKNSCVDWMGDIPADWTIVKTKHCYSNRKEIAGEFADNYQRLALTLNGVIKRSKDDSTGLQPEAFNSYQILRENELVFKLIDLANVSTSRVGYSPYTGIVSPAYIVLCPFNADESKFGKYYFLSMWQREVFNHIGDDGVRSSLNASNLLNIPYIFAPADEKKRIAAFLDDKCARIDSVVEKTRASIEEYRKLKQAIITRAVTKGIRPNRPTKDSGIDWLGDIPADWEFAQLKRFVFVNNGRETLDEVDKTEDVVPVYGSGGVFKYTTTPLYSGETVMFGRKGTLGKPIYANEKLWTVDTMYFLTFSEKLFAKFNYYQLCAFDWEPHITQTALPSIVASEIVSCKFAFPPLDEQKEIAAYLDEKTAAIDSLVAKKNRLVSELESLKKSLIFEYVTGKKEVPT